jgi:hypothetical protein
VAAQAFARILAGVMYQQDESGGQVLQALCRRDEIAHVNRRILIGTGRCAIQRVDNYQAASAAGSLRASSRRSRALASDTAG